MQIAPSSNKQSIDEFEILVAQIENNIKDKKYAGQKDGNVPSTLRHKVWTVYVSEIYRKSKCFCCRSNEIEESNFVCGHIISHHNGGSVALENLRPICAQCNNSMRSENMCVFIKRCGLWDCISTQICKLPGCNRQCYPGSPTCSKSHLELYRKAHESHPSETEKVIITIPIAKVEPQEVIRKMPILPVPPKQSIEVILPVPPKQSIEVTLPVKGDESKLPANSKGSTESPTSVLNEIDFSLLVDKRATKECKYYNLEDIKAFCRRLGITISTKRKQELIDDIQAVRRKIELINDSIMNI
jgi:hypothetical protein